MFGSKPCHAEREITFQDPISGAGKADAYFQTEEPMGTQTSVWHLQVGPGEGFGEQIQFTAPLSDRRALGVRETSTCTEGWPGDGRSVSQVIVGSWWHQSTEQTVPLPREFSASESVPVGRARRM